jgi:hypothetical protein
VVRDMERLYIEAQRGLSAAGPLHTLAAPSGPQPSALQLVEAMQDMW